MDKNNREKEMLYQWAKANSGGFCFQEIDRSKESYFEQRNFDVNSDQYIREYAIESLPELMKELDTLWGTDEIMYQVKRIVGVAALKNKPNRLEKQEETRLENKMELKDKLSAFIYNF